MSARTFLVLARGGARCNLLHVRLDFLLSLEACTAMCRLQLSIQLSQLRLEVLFLLLFLAQRGDNGLLLLGDALSRLAVETELAVGGAGEMGGRRREEWVVRKYECRGDG